MGGRDPTPELSGGVDALVRPIAVATCDLDAAVVAGRAPLPGPFAFGHEFVADVLEIGESVTSVRAGDRVIVPFQVSCGTCDVVPPRAHRQLQHRRCGRGVRHGADRVGRSGAVR